MIAIKAKIKDYMMLLMPINKKRITSRMQIRIKKTNKKSKKKVKNKRTVVHRQSKKNFLKKHNRQFHLNRK